MCRQTGREERGGREPCACVTPGDSIAAYAIRTAVRARSSSIAPSPRLLAVSRGGAFLRRLACLRRLRGLGRLRMRHILRRVAVGVDHMDLAEVQRAYGCLDLAEV